MKRLGIDHGSKRIGVAISDALGLTARPLTVIPHTARAQDAFAVATLATEHAVAEVVIGLPTGPEGEIGPRARSVQRFGDALAPLLSCPIRYWDETYSTRAAWGRRHETGMSRRKAGRTPIDAEAAAVILQGYLDGLHTP